MDIVVGNRPLTTSAEDLRRLFDPYGVVQDVRILINHHTGQPREIAFVNMPNEHEAQAAIQALHNTEFAGRRLTVGEAVRRPL